MNITQDAKQIYSFQAVLIMHPHHSKEYKHANEQQRAIFQRYDEAGKINDLISEVEKVGK